jgi:pentalenic acid synthase
MIMSTNRASAEEPHTDKRVFPHVRYEPFRPPAAYEQWREEAAVTKVGLHSDQQAWVVVRYDEARQTLEHSSISVDAQHPHYPKVRKGVTSRGNDTMLRHMDAPIHAKHRRMMARQFTAKRVNELRPELERVVSETVDSVLAQGGPINLHQEFSLVIPTKVICALLGVDYGISGDIQRLSGITTSAASTAEDLAAAAQEMFALLDAEINAQYEDPGDGLIGTLIEEAHKGEIEHRQILGQTFMTIVAGHETTANTISMGMLQLFALPEIRQRVTADTSLIPGMVEDMIRMHSLVDGTLSRVATEDIVIGGQPINAGDGVIVTISAPNYDPRRWQNPYELDIDRNDSAHLSFGAGVHMCLGQNLARAELHLAFEQLLTRIPTLRLADTPEAANMQNDGYIYGVRDLIVTW